jgi:FMN-dependent NADH-azoreductase
VTVRDLAGDPLPYLTWHHAVAARIPADQRTSDQHDAVERTTAVTDELFGADVLLLSVPLYNWGLPAHVKSWIDHLYVDERLHATEHPLAGRLAVLVNPRGGSYAPGAPRAGWDHVEPYLRQILAEHLGLDLTVITPEFTLAGVSPRMADFVEDKEKSVAKAHEAAGRAAADV